MGRSMDKPPPAPGAGTAAQNAKLVATFIVGLLPLLALAAGVGRIQGAGSPGHCCRRLTTDLSPGKVPWPRSSPARALEGGSGNGGRNGIPVLPARITQPNCRKLPVRHSIAGGIQIDRKSGA